MSEKNSASTLSSLLKKFQPSLPNDKILDGADNFQKPNKFPTVIGEVEMGHLESIQNYTEKSILKPLSDRHDKFTILVFRGGSVLSEPSVIFFLSALAYDKGDIACLEEIADQYRHQDGVGHLMNTLGVMFSERMDYKRSETCLIAAKACFQQQLDHLGNAVATLNLAFLYKLFGNNKSARSCCDDAAALCHDISMRTTKDVNLPWKVLRRVSGLCREFGNFKKYEDVLHIGVHFDINGTNEAPTGILTKQLMTLQLKEQNGEKIEAEELENLASHLFELLDRSCINDLPKTELLNADLIMIVVTVAKMYREVGCLEGACKLLEKLQNKFLLVHGGRCSLYGTLLYHIGSFKLSIGKTSEAKCTLKEAKEVFVYSFGRSHHMVASCKNLLGSCALHQGDTREASAYLNDALTLFKKRSDYHPSIAEILLKFALLNVEEGKLEDAKTTMEEALNIITLACGESSLEMANAYIQAAAVLQKVEKFRESAVDKLQKALDIFIQLGLRDNHPDVLTCHNVLGVLQLSLGQSKEAEEQFTEVQQQVVLQDVSSLTTSFLTPERSNMFFQVKNDCGADHSFMCHSLGAEVVSLANLVAMKKGEERRNHLNALLGCLRGYETGEPLLWDFAGQTVYYIAHRVWSSDRFVYCILISAPSPDWFQSHHDQDPNFEEPNVFFLSSSNGHAKNPCSIVFWKTTKVLEMKELSKVNSAFRESVNLLFLQPKFRKGYLPEQDLYMELTLPHDPRASLCSQIDSLPLLVTQELSDPHEECDSIVSVVPTSLISAAKPSAHVSYFTYRLSIQRQAVLVFDNLALSLGQALAKVGGEEISCVPALQNGAFFIFLEPSNSSLSVVVENETVLVKCRTVKDSKSSCICSLVQNALMDVMASLRCVVEVAFKPSIQLSCDGANCSCGCRDFQRESDLSLDTLEARTQVKIQEPESDYLNEKPLTEVLQNNENKEDILWAGHPDTKISTEVCVRFLDCLLSNRHVSPEVQSSDTREMSLSFDSPCLDDNPQLDSSLLSPGSMTSLNSLPTSPANAENENPFLQIKASSWPNMAVELCNEKDDFNTDCLSEKSSTGCVGFNESPLLFHVESSNSARDSSQDCSAIRSSGHEKDLPSGENVNDFETTETVQLEGSTRLRDDKTQALESEVAFYLNQNCELRQQVAELEEKLKQHDIEKEQIELELGMKSFFEDKQKRSKKILRSFSEQNNSSSVTGASYAFNGVEGKLLGGASPLHEPDISLQRRLLEISNSLSEAELEQLKFLVRPKVSGLRLKKIREGYQLFEELETNGELSCVYVRELLEGIQRFDLAEKLDLPSSDNAERWKRNKDEDACSASSSAILPSRNKKLDVLSKRFDAAADGTLVRIHQGSEGNNSDAENSGNTRHNAMVLPLNANCSDSSQQNGSSSEEHTRSGTDSSNGGFLSTESSSTTVSSSELSTNSSAIAGPLTEDSTSSSCTSQDNTLNPPFAVKNCERSDAEDSSYNSRSSQGESLQRSLLSDDTESESGGMDTVEALNPQNERISKAYKSHGNVPNGPIEPAHLEMRCAVGAGTDFVDSVPRRSTNSGLMKDALPDGDISVRSGASSGERYSAVNGSVTEISTHEWEHLGARPKNRPPVKLIPPAPSLVDLVPQEVAAPEANGVANAFLARHSQDKGLHESLYHNSAEKVLNNNTSSLGASYVDGMMNQSEHTKAKPYFGDCQADIHNGLFPFPPAGYVSHNAVGNYAYNGQFSSQTGLVPGPQYSNFPGINGNLPWSSAFNSSSNSSLRSEFELGSGRPFGMGPAVGFPSGMAGSYFGSGSVGMGVSDPQLMPPAAFGAQRYSLFNENTSTMGSEHGKTPTPLATYSGLANQSNVMANSNILPSAPTRNVSHADVCLGSGGLPAPSTIGGSSGADNRHNVDDESSGTGRTAPGTTRSNVLSSPGHQLVAGADGNTEADLPSSQYAQLLAAAYARENGEPQGASSTAGSMLNTDFGTDSVESTDNSLLALEQRVEEACALVERVLREREEREQFGREIERKEREIREQRARKRREREARELEEANRWPHQQEAITGRSQWLCEHYQRHCRVRFPCCTHFYPCHRCHNNSKACDNEEAKASHATHLKCSLCHHEQEIDEESGKCGSCGAQMSAYFCSICKHFTSVDKNPYHCEKCGICRIHKDKSFHCDVCNVCLDKRLEGKHKCRPDSGHDECCICLEDAFSGCQILPCSHKVHRECAIAMIQNGIRTCPVCRHPLYSPAPE